MKRKETGAFNGGCQGLILFFGYYFRTIIFFFLVAILHKDFLVINQYISLKISTKLVDFEKLPIS